MNWNLIIKELGIVLWQLRYPVIIDIGLHQILMHLRFLIISDVLVSLDDFFIQDVIHAMKCENKDVYLLTINKINNIILPSNFLQYCWWLGVKVLCDFNCITLRTPSLSILKNDVHSKIELWNQINCHVYHV